MSNLPTGRHAQHGAVADEDADPLSHSAMTAEIEHSRKAEYRLLLSTFIALFVVAVLIVVHLVWL